MAVRMKRGDPFDGLTGGLALWVALSAWLGAFAGATGAPDTPALDGFMVIAGLMAARASRYGLADRSDLPNFLFWRSLRALPVVAGALALYLCVFISLASAGLWRAEDGFFNANPLAAVPLAILAGSLIYALADLSGALRGARGRAVLAAAAAACIAARAVGDISLSPVADFAARLTAAFALGAFLDSVNSSSRFARALRRLKLRQGAMAETAAVAGMVLLVAFTPDAALIFAPLALAGCLAVFLRKRDRVSDALLGGVAARRLGAWSMPLIVGPFLLIWPTREAISAGLVADPGAASTLLAPIYILLLVGLAGALNRIVEEPVRAFVDRCREIWAEARAEAAAGATTKANAGAAAGPGGEGVAKAERGS